MTNPLVSIHWLKNHLTDGHIVLLDASPSFDATQIITGARHFDIKNTFSDQDNPLPNAFPSQEQFEREARKIGIDSKSHIIVYDTKGIFTSPRVWWMFKVFGHEKISVLNGGLPEWNKLDYPIVQSTMGSYETGNFIAKLDLEKVKSFDEITANITSHEAILIDARSASRFNGSEPEPRPQIKSGGIKNSINLPYTEVLDEGKYKTKEALTAIFNTLGLEDKPLIFSCGSGITACIILLGYYLVSDKIASVYDGSWTEWATRQELFVE